MAAIDDDPISWGVESVVHELCYAQNRPWVPKVATKRPDPGVLSQQLREQEVDGEVLLTYEDVMPPITGLLTALGVSKPPHQMTLVRAIAWLKSQSPGYRKFKDELVKPGLDSPDGSQEANHQAVPLAPQSSSNTPAQDFDMQGSLETQNANTEPRDRHDTAAKVAVQQLNGVSSAPPTKSNHEKLETADEPPQKKRRLAPSLVSTHVATSKDTPISNAAAGVLSSINNTLTDSSSIPSFSSEPWNHAPDSLGAAHDAYFGGQGMVTTNWVPKSSLYPSDTEPMASAAFCVVTGRSLPKGKRIQIYRATRRLFSKNNTSLKELRAGFSPYVELEEEEKALPLFGESDTEGEYDSDTLREIEEEEEGLRREQAQNLTPEDVSRVMQEEISRMEKLWEEVKLPRKERKANSIWKRNRRHQRSQEIASASIRLKNLDTRIGKICAEMQQDEWSKEDQLRRQMLSLEASVQDRKAERWLIAMLKGPEPPGPETLPRLLRATPQREALSDADGEIITSDEEDHDGFIVNDMKAIVFSPEPLETRPATPMAMDDAEQLAERRPQGPPTPQNKTALQDSVLSQANGQVIDLTGADSDPTNEQPKKVVRINLVTPTKAKDARPSTTRPSAETEDEKVYHYSGDDLDIPYHEPEKIADIPLTVWKDHNDRERLLIGVLWKIDKQLRRGFFHVIQTMDSNDIWSDIVQPAIEEPGSEVHKPASSIGNVTARLFRIFAFIKVPSAGGDLTKAISRARAKKLRAQFLRFEDFCDFVREDVAPHFRDDENAASPDPEQFNDIRRDNTPDAHSEILTDDDVEHTPSKKRRRPIVLDQVAKNLRENDHQRLQEQEKRRTELRKKLAASDNIPSDKSRLIINMSKQEDQGLIYVHKDIGARIKNHQIEGVRFMWNQIICDPKVRQGCLLAHTMGLGKTMQVITLLVAIAEAAQSSDESVSSQIPTDLRNSKTLILCPALLVDNWMDELLMWTPPGMLGQFLRIESATKEEDRIPLIRLWDEEGGILIVGYDMFKRLVDSDKELSQGTNAKTAGELLTQAPNVVIADEAHRLKNPTAKVSYSANRFRTQSRIALTGSPLANNVEEFYYMINWVAPHYLGPLSEFRELYVKPIEEGLYGDSSPQQFRKARKQLAVLEETVAPKTHRATIKSCLRNLPDKKEFILTVSLTPLQARLYDAYVTVIRQELPGHGLSTLGTVSNLQLIVNHPRCWQRRLGDERNSVLQGKRQNGRLSLSLPQKVISDGLKIMSTQDVLSPMLSWRTQLLTGILDESEKIGDKVLVFTQSIPTLDYLEMLLRNQKRKISRLDGDTKINQRQQQIKDFNTGDRQVYLISTTAGGIGLNIHGANRVVLFDFKYNPIHEQQAVGRAYRIGQQKPVYVYKFVAGGTFEEALQNKAVFKTQLASRVVDKENPRRWSTKDNDYLKDRFEPIQNDLSGFVGHEVDVVLDGLLKDPVLSSGIRKIIGTDTFEEEDLTEVLTPEDKKDVKDQVRMNSLRNSNPDEFRRLEQERLNRLRAVSPQFPSMAVMSGLPTTSTQSSALPKGGIETPIPPPTPWADRSAGQISPLGRVTVSNSATPQGHHVLSSMPLESLESSHASTREGYSTTHASEPMGATSLQVHATSNMEAPPQIPSEQRGVMPTPMAGANTFFRTQPETIASTTEAYTSPYPSSTMKPPSKTSKQLIVWPDQFEQKILEYIKNTTDQDVLQAIDDNHIKLARRIAESTWRVTVELLKGEFPIDKHMKRLCGLMESPRFAAAVVTEHLPPARLANCNTYVGLDSMVKDLNDLNAQQFRQKLKLGVHSKPRDPNNLQNVLNRPNGGQPSNHISTVSAMDDLEVMREVADRRKRRPPRLPTWASKAVEEGKQEETYRRPRDPFQLSPSPPPEGPRM